jgi:hypothetical protein
MFTESALLRTMDAIQSSPPTDAAVHVGGTARQSGPAKKKTRREELRRKRKIKRRDDLTVNDDGRADDDDFLFCIDRVGDRDVAATLEDLGGPGASLFDVRPPRRRIARELGQPEPERPRQLSQLQRVIIIMNRCYFDGPHTTLSLT